MDDPLFYLESVSFGYASGEQVFSDVSLQIRRGRRFVCWELMARENLPS